MSPPLVLPQKKKYTFFTTAFSDVGKIIIPVIILFFRFRVKRAMYYWFYHDLCLFFVAVHLHEFDQKDCSDHLHHHEVFNRMLFLIDALRDLIFKLPNSFPNNWKKGGKIGKINT